MTDIKTFDLTNMDKQDAYGLLTSAVVPRPIAYVTSLGNNNVLNGAPFSYFNVISTKPPLLMISVGMREDKRKDTAVNIETSRAFVVNMVEHDQIEPVNQSAKHHPAAESEVTVVGLTPVESTVVRVPGILESTVRFECTLNAVYPIYDQAVKTGELIVGHIERMHVKTEALKNGVLDPKKYRPIARLGGRNYALLGDVFSLKRPE